VRRLAGIAKALLGIAVGFVIGAAINHAIATRNSSGTDSAVNGPYASGQVISSTQINARFADAETEITNSLDRSGRGGMLAPLRGTLGSNAAPAFSFTSDTDTGAYSAGANLFDVAAGGTKIQEWSTTGTSVTGTATVSSTLGVTGASSLTGNVDVGTTAQGNATTRKALTFNAGGFAAPQAPFTDSNGDKLVLYSNSTDTMDARVGIGASADLWFKSSNSGGTAFTRFYTGSTPTERVRISDSGLAIGATGNAISASYRGTVAVTSCVIPANTCLTRSITTGLGSTASGAECAIGSTASIAVALTVSCQTLAGQCNVIVCNPTTGALTEPNNTYSCRVFNP